MLCLIGVNEPQLAMVRQFIGDISPFISSFTLFMSLVILGPPCNIWNHLDSLLGKYTVRLGFAFFFGDLLVHSGNLT